MVRGKRRAHPRNLVAGDAALRYKKMMADNAEVPDGLMEMMIRDAGDGLPEMSDRDWAGFILERLDYEQQLIAISALLERNVAADKRITEQMKELDEEARKSTGWRNERATDEWGEYFYLSVYQDAAHSMAALGMIAPLFESLFFQAFQGIREKYFGVEHIPAGEPRAAMINDDTLAEADALTKADAFWDCYYYFDRKEAEIKDNLVAGIRQLSKAVGLKAKLPKDLHRTLEALFEYRNYMFHNGFEWPEARCAQFAARIEKCGWQDWFTTFTRGDKPWIFYMTEAFIAHCLDMVHKVREALGAYCRGRIPITTIPIEGVTASVVSAGNGAEKSSDAVGEWLTKVGEIAPGLNGFLQERDGTVHVVAVISVEPGKGNLSRFLDRLPTDKRIMFHDVGNDILRDALRRRRFMRSDSYSLFLNKDCENNYVRDGKDANATLGHESL
jgi:hypothetical protein